MHSLLINVRASLIVLNNLPVSRGQHAYYDEYFLEPDPHKIY